MDDLISRQQAVDALCSECQGQCIPCESYPCSEVEAINALPSAQPEQKYTNKELQVFMNGISLRLLSLRSAQHWKYDNETAEEIEFLERLYKKVESEVTQ